MTVGIVVILLMAGRTARQSLSGGRDVARNLAVNSTTSLCVRGVVVVVLVSVGEIE